MISSNPNWCPQTFSPNTVTLGARASAYKRGGGHSSGRSTPSCQWAVELLLLLRRLLLVGLPPLPRRVTTTWSCCPAVNHRQGLCLDSFFACGCLVLSAPLAEKSLLYCIAFVPLSKRSTGSICVSIFMWLIF